MALKSKRLYVFNLLIGILPPSRLCKFKASMLRWCGAKVGKNAEIFTPKIMGNFNLELGDNTFLGHNCFISGPKGSTIRIEDNAIIGSKVIILTGTHKFTPEGPRIEGVGEWKDVTIKNGAAVSTASIILPGKTIGEMSHVAAGAVVTHDVPPYTRVGGNPARIIKNFKEQSLDKEPQPNAF